MIDTFMNNIHKRVTPLVTGELSEIYVRDGDTRIAWSTEPDLKKIYGYVAIEPKVSDVHSLRVGVRKGQLRKSIRESFSRLAPRAKRDVGERADDHVLTATMRHYSLEFTWELPLGALTLRSGDIWCVIHRCIQLERAIYREGGSEASRYG
jgi:hypothetical protein